MLFKNAKQVKLSEVELDPADELKVIFVPLSDYEEVRRMFCSDYDFNMFYDILLTVHVTREGRPGVLIFTYNADTASTVTSTGKQNPRRAAEREKPLSSYHKND